MVSEFKEIKQLEKVIKRLPSTAKVEVLASVKVNHYDFPIYAITLGSDSAEAPVFGVFGGVHGLEKVGTHLVTSYLSSLSQLFEWDELVTSFMEKAKWIFVPLVNPGGMYLKRRSNPNGVDLMRNAPVESDTIGSFNLLSGHRYSSRLPWYRGGVDDEMEVESACILNFVKRECFDSPFVLTLDVHSGFGLRDRIWFPYAHSKSPFPNIAEMYALRRLMKRSYPNHVYRVEPQCLAYTTHGDLWDYLYEEYQSIGRGCFLPLTLEMGSWNWLRKNPRQFFSPHGAFNPIIPHRYQRTMRRHRMLIDFLSRAALGYKNWANLDKETTVSLSNKAIHKWFE